MWEEEPTLSAEGAERVGHPPPILSLPENAGTDGEKLGGDKQKKKAAPRSGEVKVGG